MSWLNRPRWPDMAVTEARSAAVAPSVPTRRGIEFGIPAGGTMNQYSQAAGGPRSRSELMDQLHACYLQCPWVSAPIDVTARAVTAGGVQLVAVGDDDTETPEVKQAQELLEFVNPREDMVQLLRSTVTDLLIFGDAYIEVTKVLRVPVALYTLDAATMSVKADQHGQITGYEQEVGDNRPPVSFAPDEVIHISLDAPRGGLYGRSPTEKQILSITSWLFTAACLKDAARRGFPPHVHVDAPKATSEADLERWGAKYIVDNLGSRNWGNPVLSRGGYGIHELASARIEDLLVALDRLRDTIIAGYGTPPHKVGIIESGNLGGGTGEEQDKTFRYMTVGPIAALVLEKLNYSIIREGFGIDGWALEFPEVDFRDSKVIEEIRDSRLRNGSWTLNRYRADIGEQPVSGGDDAVIIDRGKIVFWRDIATYTQAEIDQMEAPLVAAGQKPQSGQPVPTGTKAAESAPDDDMRALNEAWRREYRSRRKRALRELPAVEEA